MALTTTEEAQVRQLIDQNAALLSLASSEPTIISKLAAAKVSLADLSAASSVSDDDILLMRQGTNDNSVTAEKIADYIASRVGIPTAVAGGTADAITADFTPNVAMTNGTTVIVRAGAANATTTPTFAPDGLAAKTIVKGNNLALVAGDIAGAGHWLEMNFDTTLDKWVLQNPACPFGGFAASLSDTGYQKLPSGLIIQWVRGATLGAASSGLVTLPIAFPNGILAEYATQANGADTAPNFASFSTWKFSASQVKVYCSSASGPLFDLFVIGY